MHTPAPLRPVEEQLQLLVAYLRSHKGGLLIVASPDAEAERLLGEEVRARVQTDIAIEEVSLAAEPVERLSLSHHLSTLPARIEKAAVFVRSLDELPAAARDTAINAMNWGRERLRWSGYTVVLWVRPGTVGDLGRRAPDFFSWRSDVFDFDVPLDPVERADLFARLRLFHPSAQSTLLQQYRDYVIRMYQWLDFRGLLQMRNVVRVPLAEVFVPLQATTQIGTALLSEIPQIADESALPERRFYERPAVERRVSLNEAAQHHQRFAVLGDPGSGKSTFLRFLALLFAQGSSAVRERLTLDEDRLPILIPLSVFAEVRREQPHLFLAAFLPQYFVSQGLPDFSSLFADAITSGQAIVLLDGLDEMLTAEARTAVIHAVVEFANTYPTTRVVITSRLAGYVTGMLPASFATFTLAPFDADDIKRFAQQWSLAFEAIGLPPDTELPPDTRQRAHLRAESLSAAATSHPGIQRLATNPLLLTLLALIHHQGTRLPHRRSELYRLCVEALAETWNLARSLTGRPIDLYLGNRRLDEQFVVQTLAPVAYWMHENKPTGFISRAELEARIAAQWIEHDGLSAKKAAVLAHDFVSLAREQMGLLVERAADEFSFLHLSVQEYLAAQFLVGCTDAYKRLRPRLHLPRWREVILLTASCLSGGHAAKLVDNILNTHGPFDNLVSHASALGQLQKNSKMVNTLLSLFILKKEQKNSSVVNTLLSLSMLVLAARCLGDEVAIPVRLRQSIHETLFALWRDPPFFPFRQEIERIFLSLNDRAISDDMLAILRNHSEDAPLRGNTAHTLGVLGQDHPEVLATLLAFSLDRSEDGFVRQSAVAALGSLGQNHPEVLSTLLTFLQDQNEERVVRSDAARALGSLGHDHPETLTTLLTLLQDRSEDPIVRYSSAIALGQNYPGILPMLLTLLQDQSEEDFVRLGAVLALGSFGQDHPGILPTLLTLLQDRNENQLLRGSAARTLGSFGQDHPGILPTLLTLLQDRSEDKSVRLGVARALGSLGQNHPNVLSTLFSLLQDRTEDKFVRSGAATALGSLSSAQPEVIETLLSSVSDSEVGKEALEALWKLLTREVWNPVG